MEYISNTSKNHTQITQRAVYNNFGAHNVLDQYTNIFIIFPQARDVLSTGLYRSTQRAQLIQINKYNKNIYNMTFDFKSQIYT